MRSSTEMEESSTQSVCNFSALEALSGDSIQEILESYNGFCSTSDALLNSPSGDISVGREFVSQARVLCKHGLESLVHDLFLKSLEEAFESRGALRFWRHFEVYKDDSTVDGSEVQQVLCKALEEISSVKQYQEKCLLMLVDGLERDGEGRYLCSKYQLMVSSVLMASLPRHFPDRNRFLEILHSYFKGKLEELSTIMEGENDGDEDSEEDEMELDEKGKPSHKIGAMDVDEFSPQGKFTENNKLVKNIGKVVRRLRSLGFTSMTEDAYASAIFLLLKDKVNDLAGDDYRGSVLESIKQWIQAVPLQFLSALLAYLGDSTSYSSPSPICSSPAIEDLKQCLEYTGQHSKLVESFTSALRYRLLTAGASTNDILHQYVSTIKALRTIDPTGIFLEAVGEPIRDYLRGRKDTIKCIVTMLTDGSGGNAAASGIAGDSLLEELNRDEEGQENNVADDDFSTDDKQAWINAANWEPDPAEADPLKGSRNQRKVDILGMIVSIIGSKDQLVNEYRVMLAEKLLSKSDYDIASEIRTLELLKIHFGEISMQKCEIMLNDLIDSKRNNHNIKTTIQPSETGTEQQEMGAIMDNLSATIISSNFWPPIQDEALTLPAPIDQLLTDYANRYHEIKTPRKLLWKKNLGTVKLELQFEDREVQFTVTPIHAAIIMQFQDQTSWTSNQLASTLGVPVDVLNRRITFWISKGIVAESLGTEPNDNVYTLVEGNADAGKNAGVSGTCEELLPGDDEGESSVASAEDQLRKEMTVYEKYIMGMLMNFSSMTLDRIHNTLKMFCVADAPYDKSLQQLQSFLSGLVLEEKVELRDGNYFLKK
ncbi:Anaphase-promoting complex subunit 2 [Linum perenne]